MDAVAARLTQMGIEFRRDTPQIDAAVLGPQRMQQIRALPEGETFVIPENGVVSVGVITSERAEPVSPANARPLAVQALRNKQLAATIPNRQSVRYGRRGSVRVDLGSHLISKKKKT